MHPLLVMEIVLRCKKRIEEGDCPTAPPFPVEMLEEALVWCAEHAGMLDDEPESETPPPGGTRP
jgi:hypothetical protein